MAMGHFRRRSCEETMHFPPPMPLLAQIGDLSGPMPWFLKRSYTDRGSLVLQEVKAKHHRFFRACRVNGRLTLRLMHSSECNLRNPDDSIEEKDDDEEENEKSEVESGKTVAGLSMLSSSSSSAASSPLVPLLLEEDRWSTQENLCRIRNEKQLSRAASSPSLLSVSKA